MAPKEARPPAPASSSSAGWLAATAARVDDRRGWHPRHEPRYSGVEHALAAQHLSGAAEEVAEIVLEQTGRPFYLRLKPGDKKELAYLAAQWKREQADSVPVGFEPTAACRVIEGRPCLLYTSDAADE